MFSRIFNGSLCHSSQAFALQMDESMRDEIKRLISIRYHTSSIMMDEHLDDIKFGLDTYKKNIGIENVKQLNKDLIKFLYDYQSAIYYQSDIPFGKISYIQRLQPNKYWFKNGFRIKTEKQFCYNIHDLWVDEAAVFLDGKKELTDQILAVYSELDYRYQHQTTYNRNDLQKWTFKMNKDGIIENKSEKVTLAQVLCGLITYQDGIYNDNGHTRNWGLYNSTFYNVVLFKVLGKIINEIRIQFNDDYDTNILDNGTDILTDDVLEYDNKDNHTIDIKLE